MTEDFNPKEARALVNEYDRQNPIRMASVHDSLCTCTRCLRDTLTAALDEIERLRKALGAMLDLQDNASPFGGEIYQDRGDRVFDQCRAALKGPDQ